MNAIIRCLGVVLLVRRQNIRILCRSLAILVMAISVCVALVGCHGKTEPDVPTLPIDPNAQQGKDPTTGTNIPNIPVVDDAVDSPFGWIGDTQLYCERLATYSGQFVEDSSDRKVSNIAVMLVTNRSDRYLDIAMLTYEIDGKTAEFKVTGLPAGKSAWVLESTGMQLNTNPEVTYQDSVVAFRDEVITQPEGLTLSHKGNTLQVTNETDHTLYNVMVFYKALHTDGNFLGGITYAVNFGDVKAGASAESLAGHYKEDRTEVIRFAWLDEPIIEDDSQ